MIFVEDALDPSDLADQGVISAPDASGRDTLPDLGDQQGAVVVGGMAAGELVDGLDHGADDPRRVEVAAAQDLVEPIDAELGAAVVHGLGDAVGVEGQDVAGLERQGRLVVLEVVEQAQRRAADLVERVDDPSPHRFSRGGLCPAQA